ncbi:dnaJ homolog subfamily C member 30, mitochondrial-like [Cydia splendana]|uniref:dnaJ homolog subfamily C member 30, mitochondrial-like n=1 Tax=Cydia splendana TaxID=1100963 RepID=UPI00214638CF
MLRQNKTRLVRNVVRTLHTSSVAYANHYEVLGVTPRSTQNDIKSAYYKLSKLYHPDKSSDDASAKKFRAISEAYEVLGNVKLKKMYDKGLLTRESPHSHTDYRPEPEPTDPTLKFYKSRASRHITPTMDGKVPIYDFDAWSKNHYGDVFKKSQYDKEILRKKREKQMDAVHSNRQEATIYILFALTGLFFALVLRGQSEYDVDRTRKIETIQSSTEDKIESS